MSSSSSSSSSSSKEEQIDNKEKPSSVSDLIKKIQQELNEITQHPLRAQPYSQHLLTCPTTITSQQLRAFADFTANAAYVSDERKAEIAAASDLELWQLLIEMTNTVAPPPLRYTNWVSWSLQIAILTLAEKNTAKETDVETLGRELVQHSNDLLRSHAANVQMTSDQQQFHDAVAEACAPHIYRDK